MRKLSKKDRIKLAIAGIALAICLCCQGWYYWPWIGGNIVRLSPSAASTINRTPTISSYSYAELELVNTTELSRRKIGQIFHEVAFSIETGMSSGVIHKWSSPLYMFIDGSPSDEDYTVISEICEKMNAVPGFPGIYIVDTSDSANVFLHLYDDSEYDLWEKRYMLYGSKGLTVFDFNKETHGFNSIDVGIRNNQSRYDKTSVLWEEILQCGGFTNDTLRTRNTLFYQGTYNVPKATDLDWILFRLLYLPQIKPGMTFMNCLPYIYYFIR
ncbi:MAG: DUF2927 domain-containing protein [Lachnospiraceae bacterium]|nr:DUF2927 domain-containing protein [Lachnospiraceae bacterium]